MVRPPMSLPRLLLLLFLLAAGSPQAQTVPVAPVAPVARPVLPIPQPPSLRVSSYLLIEHESGQVLAAYQPDLKVEPASITKVLSAYVVFHELKAGRLKLDELVRVSEKAWRTGGSRMFLPAGASVKVQDLILGMIVQSGNDATIALAEHIGGSEEGFVSMMNEYARRLGMHDSAFTNATGLPDPGLYTTASDLGKLARAIIREFPEYYAWYRVKSFTWNNIEQPNRNTLLQRDETVDGLKTGHTSSAGYCLVSTAKREDTRLIAVVMGSKSERARADESQALLNFGFRNYEFHTIFTAGQVLREWPVYKGEVAQVRLGVAEAVRMLVPRGHIESLRSETEQPSTLIAPIAKGQSIGRVRVMLNDQVLLDQPMVALDEVPDGGFFRRSIDTLKLWWEH
jgi:D-alanyl-D-alanine carboxypeptidase (penicillin-binding protein 5/6)